MGQTSKFITIIRPEFMEFCGDACRAAALNHLFYRIAGKCKDQPKEKIQAGEILWYGSNELITEEMSNAWGVCKVRKEVNELIGMNLFGKTSNPDWGADRTKHFFFGTEQCAKFLQLCEEHNICFVHLDLPDEVKHLIYSSNANDKSIKCTCKQPEMVDANDKSIKCNSYIHPMETMNISNANDKSIEAITKNTTKINNIEDYKERESTASESHTPTVSPPAVGDSRASSPQSENHSQQGEHTHEGIEHPFTCYFEGQYYAACPLQETSANTPTTPPTQVLPPGTEQAAPGQAPKWNVETMVADAERLREKPFSAIAKPKETKKAQVLFKRKPDLTQEEFEDAWKNWDTDWWRKTNGPFTLTDLAATPKDKSEMRLILALEKLALAKANPRQSSQLMSVPRVRVFSSYDDPNFRSDQDFYPVEGGSYAAVV